ncbi:lysophospholipase D GDPD1 [Folsomia candida]|uniref:lysophospholipase D GDPD1 n=1 Tax=Folsomia candida TaxID=158441 RepID=UPI000B8F3860|nr:lysophospholipase D GDPD1 [Folsomia candida]
MTICCPAALGAFVTYAIASTFFWHYPHLLHKKKRVAFTAAHISHRGGSAEGYENTIRAFRNAIDKGTDMLELDVRLTKDGRVVVFHDADLSRMTGKNVKISDLEYSQLPILCPAVHIDTIPGTKFSDLSWPEDDRRIPLLRQVFREFPTVPMNIDIKDNDDKLIRKVGKLLNEFHRTEITVWGSFNNRVCKQCFVTSPDTHLFFSATRVIVLVLFAVTGILPFIPLRESHYEVFLPLAMKKRRLQNGGKLSLTETVILFFSSLLVWKPMIAHLQRRGIQVYLWVCNSEEEFAACKSVNATGIMTDRPTKLREFLDKRDPPK